MCPRHQHLISAADVSPAAAPRPRQQGGSCVEAGVQAGPPAVHHYLTNPTLDAVFNSAPAAPHHPRLGGHLSRDTVDLATSSVIDLMRRQLLLTEQQMQSQKALYKSFCRSLEQTQNKRVDRHEESHEKIIFGRSKRPEKLTFDEALRQVKEEMRRQEEDMKAHLPVSVEKRSKKSHKKKSKTESLHSSNKNLTVNSIQEESIPTPTVKENVETYETDFEEDSEIHTETFRSHST